MFSNFYHFFTFFKSWSRKCREPEMSEPEMPGRKCWRRKCRAIDVSTTTRDGRISLFFAFFWRGICEKLNSKNVYIFKLTKIPVSSATSWQLLPSCRVPILRYQWCPTIINSTYVLMYTSRLLITDYASRDAQKLSLPLTEDGIFSNFLITEDGKNDPNFHGSTEDGFFY